MTALYRTVGTPRRGGIVCVADHASNFVPGDIELGVADAVMGQHVAWDIGVAGVAERMARRHDLPCFLAGVSRLVIDLHREEDSPGLIPETSDGILIPGNIGADRDMRLGRFHRPYHAAMAQWLEAAAPALIVSLHSFTPALASDPQARPWEVALLHNQDDRAARHAIRMFEAEGLTVGDNQPYSGRALNATMNRHAEALGRPYLAIEVRQDGITRRDGQARWAAMIADVAHRTMIAVR